jgi:ubiquinone/menaquinone biosynthesis C-methylase UbiE
LLRAKRRASRRRLLNCEFRKGDAHALPASLCHVDAIVMSRLFLIVRVLSRNPLLAFAPGFH